MAQRIKGQEIEVILVQDNVPLSTITDVTSFEIAPQFDKLQEGYLGETTDRFDEVFKGVNGRMELHFENQDVIDLVLSVLARAARRTPGTKINVKATLNFPSGVSTKIIMTDCFFGPMPINFGSRTDYGKVTLEFSSSNIKKLSV